MARTTRKKSSGGFIKLALLLVILGGGAYYVSRVDTTPKTPEAAAFKAANSRIGSHKDGIGFGNNELTQKIANDFAESVRKIDKMMFSGHKDRAISLTDENFLTYVHSGTNGTVFLIHVPQFKRYKDDVRAMLTDMCWAGAQLVCEQHGHKGVKLCVALRGSVFYGAIAEGDFGPGAPSVEKAAVIRDDRLHKYFED